MIIFRASTLLLCFVFSALSSVASAEQDRRFEINPGFGFALDSSANSTLAFNAGAFYFLTDHISLGPMFHLYANDGITEYDTPGTNAPAVSTRFQEVTLATGPQLNLVTSGSDLEARFSLGAGWIRILDEENGFFLPIGIGAHYVFPQGLRHQYGFGTAMSLGITTLSDTHLIWTWQVLSVFARF